MVTGLQHSAHLGSAKETPRFLQIVIAACGFRRMHVYVESSDHKKADVFLKAGVLPRGALCGRPPARDKIDPLVVVFSEIKRCQNPQFTQIVQKAKTSGRDEMLLFLHTSFPNGARSCFSVASHAYHDRSIWQIWHHLANLSAVVNLS